MDAAQPDLAKLRADIQEMLGKYDEAIAMVSSGGAAQPAVSTISPACG